VTRNFICLEVALDASSWILCYLFWIDCNFFAGSLALHLAPAVSALTAMKLCGALEPGEGVHNVLLSGLGFAFVWVGWLAHSAGAAAAAGAPLATVILNAQVRML
jgi:ammonia channel protein AmtB